MPAATWIAACARRSMPGAAVGDSRTGHHASRYALQVIRSFADVPTERLWARQRTRKLGPRIERTALRKLVTLDAAEALDDLKVPPGNGLEALEGDRAGQHSIRINQQSRICFVWTPAGPEDVEIVEYHYKGAHMATIAPIHPGEVLLEEFLVPLEFTQHRLAVSIGVPQRRVGWVEVRKPSAEPRRCSSRR